MSVLVIAEHDNSNLKTFSLNAINAASKIDSDIHVLVAGNKCENVSKEVASIPLVKKVLQWADQTTVFDIELIIVDDGSDSATKQVLSEINLEKQQVEVITRRANGGKGAAVITGLLAALAKGFTHALQVDADGQHQQ
jgi:electron transfer flavoprotein alpha subunit